MFSKSGPQLGAVVIDAKITCLGALVIGTELPRPRRCRRRCGGHMAATSASGSLAPSLAPGLLAPSLTPRSMAPRWCFNPPSNLPGRGFFLFFLIPLGFLLSPLRPTSRIDILDLENFDLIHRSSRARYPRSPPSFFSH